MNRDQQNMLNSGLTRDREIVIARRIAPKQSRDAGDCFASLWSAIAAMTTKGWREFWRGQLSQKSPEKGEIFFPSGVGDCVVAEVHSVKRFITETLRLKVNEKKSTNSR